jgi:hypothetical protein
LLAEVGRDGIAGDELREAERDHGRPEAEQDECRRAADDEADERRERDARTAHGERRS